MGKLWKSKKAINDVGIIAVIISIFIATAIVIPFINEEFGTLSGTFDTDNVGTQLVGENPQDVTGVKAGDVLKSIGKIFFWTFGDLPFWLDAIFLILRFILLITILKNFIPFLG